MPRRKGYKGHQLAGGTFVVVGFALWVVGVKLKQQAEYDMRPDDSVWMAVLGAGVVAFIIGTVWFLGAKLAAWWSE